MNSDSPSDFRAMRDTIRQFVAERAWDRFHTPKNLAVSLIVEAGELLEPFQWLDSGELSELTDIQLAQVRHEAADVLVYLIRLADKLEFDLPDAVQAKLEQNRIKYPIDLAKGNARKYTEF